MGQAQAILSGADFRQEAALSKYVDWVDQLQAQYTFTAEDAMDILRKETGKVFAAVLEDAGVYKHTPEGRKVFRAFVEPVNTEKGWETALFLSSATIGCDNSRSCCCSWKPKCDTIGASKRKEWSKYDIWRKAAGTAAEGGHVSGWAGGKAGGVQAGGFQMGTG